MSVLSTESFIAFEAINSIDDTFVAANTTARNAVAANLRRAGYQVAIAQNTTAGSSSGFAVRPDPVNPERNALFFSSGGVTTPTVAAAIRKILPIINGEALVGGFTLFIPNEYVKSNVSTTTPLFRITASGQGDASWGAIGTDANNLTREVLRISQDLQIRYATDAAQSQKTLVPGRINFIEYRISTNDIRVWIDDVLVMQKNSIALNVETIAFIFEQNALVGGSTNLTAAPGRWSIGNWYNLVEDIYAPNVRLGPTTRIIGVRPNTDIDVHFQRPNGFASNAAVASSNLVDAPAATLQSTSVGDQDIYATTTDTTTASGKMIHAVAVKVLASNLESNPHAIRPILRSQGGVESSTPKPREWRLMASPISTKQLNVVVRRPTDGKIFAAGNSIALLTNAQDGAQGTPWTLISDDGGGVHYTALAFRSDGWGVLGRSDGKYQFIPPGQDAPNAAVAIQANANLINHILAIPSGKFVVACNGNKIMLGPLATTSTPDVVANWTIATPQIANIKMVAYSPTLGTGSGRILVLSDQAGALINTARSDDNGATWATSYNGANTNTNAVVLWDGSAFHTLATATGTARKSTDGSTWVADGSTWNSIGGQQLIGGTADGTTMIAVGANGIATVCNNSSDWRPISKATTASLRSICTLASGDYLAVGDAGAVVQYTTGVTDGSMAPLGGYIPYYNVATLNPATGTAWTPAEAAGAQFGMRLTS